MIGVSIYGWIKPEEFQSRVGYLDVEHRYSGIVLDDLSTSLSINMEQHDQLIAVLQESKERLAKAIAEQEAVTPTRQPSEEKRIEETEEVPF